jgi:signal transduction histidine kinase
MINVSRYAKAHNSKLSMEQDCKRVRIEVKDDGIGFDVSKSMLTQAKPVDLDFLPSMSD